MIEHLLGALTIWLALLLYLLPTMVAAHRRLEVLPRLLFRNLSLGWTGVVWLACLWVATRRRRRRVTASEAAARFHQHDRSPDWVQLVPRDSRGWRVVPGATAPLLPPGAS